MRVLLQQAIDDLEDDATNLARVHVLRVTHAVQRPRSPAGASNASPGPVDCEVRPSGALTSRFIPTASNPSAGIRGWRRRPHCTADPGGCTATAVHQRRERAD